MRKIKKITALHNRRKGFSLVELVVYASILALILVLIVHTVLAISSSYTHLKVIRNTENSAAVSMERITRSIRDAESVNNDGSILNANPGKLKLNTSVGGAGGSVELYLASTTLRIKENGVDMGPLTATGTRVTNLIFRPIQSPNSAAVKIEMEVEGSERNVLKTYKLYSTIILRGSY